MIIYITKYEVRNMDLLNYKETIDRLITILSYKKSANQKKINEIDKIDRLKKYLTKDTDDSLRGIIEINDIELDELFKEFCDTNYTLKDIGIKKYWINEGYNNPVIKNSTQFIEAKRVFSLLVDKIQMYLDYTRTFILNKENILKELNIIDSLKDKIINNDIVVDLPNYYSIFNKTESLNNKNIYLLLSAICVNNLNYIDDNAIISELDYNNEYISNIINLINKLISQFEKGVINKNSLSDKLVELEALKNKLNNNYELLYDIYPNIISDIMKDVWDKEDIDYYIERLAIPIALIKGKNKGLDLQLSGEDSQIIEEFIDDINNKVKKLSLKQEEYNENNISNNKEILYLRNITSKLDFSNEELLDFNDFITIINILIDKKETHEYILDTINNLNIINLQKYVEINRFDNLKNNKKKNDSMNNGDCKIDKRNLKKLEILFNKYGFNYDAFSKRLINELLSNTDYDNIKNMVEYINSTNELSFLKDYTIELGNNNIDKDIQEIKCSQICFILAYSSQEILNNLIKISKEDNIELTDIFSIPKVFASKNNDKVSGTYEDFVLNEKMIKEDYHQILNELISNYPFVFGTDSYLFRKNIELLELYGMNISIDSKGTLPSPVILTIDNYESIIDSFIEANEYDYIEKYRNILCGNYNKELQTMYKKLKGIDILNKKYYNFTVFFDKKIDDYLKDLSLENIPVAYSESVIKKLEKINEEKDPLKQKIQYVINGITISRIKVLKYFSTLMINKYKNKKEALLYSIVKNSYLTKNEFDMLKNIIYGGK